MRSDLYQTLLISLGVVATILFGIFFWRELNPEYKIYQTDYVELEQFRSTYTGESPPLFTEGIKQIVIEKEDHRAPVIDRCISCHVALEFPHFSPTRIAYDINGNIIVDEEGIPVQAPNPDYIWTKLDAKIAELRDSKVNEQLESEGEKRKVQARLEQAKKYESLKRAHVGEHSYDVTKVLRMHPLIGKETRPFEFHPVEEYGCVSCHNGNGRGLTTDKAHGPVFDGTYSVEFMGPKPQFLEPDSKNDPEFARVFNDKPGPELIFQTDPIYVGQLIQAKCMQCHQSSQNAFLGALSKVIDITSSKADLSQTVEKALNNEKQALIELLKIWKEIQSTDLINVVQKSENQAKNYSLPEKEREKYGAHVEYLRNLAGVKNGQAIPKTPDVQHRVLEALNQKIAGIVGSIALMNELEGSVKGQSGNAAEVVQKFIAAHQDDPQATGSLFTKMSYLNFEKETLQHIKDTETSFAQTLNDQKTISTIQNEVDLLTRGYRRGEDLYISQACYACHRIAGFSRGGVGPELTMEGKGYPWFIKRKLMWPQGDLKTSTMPNYRLDHAELEPLMAFVLAQVGENKSISDTAYKAAVQEWESGRKMAWEKPITPAQMHDLRFSMTVFATEGCAACHRLKGFESDVGFRIEKGAKGKADFDVLYKEKEWFNRLFPESIEGSDIVKVLETHAREIDQRIVDNVRTGSILEEIDQKHPEAIESFYPNFRYATRAKNYQLTQQASQAPDPQKKEQILNELKEWKQRVNRVLKVYIQAYGLGRLIGPRPNWSGIYRTDEWLMEHFRKPTSHVARSIMPILPFDDTKFYALTYMLDILGKQNRDEVRAIWEHNGFNPEQAAQIHCAQCHGEFLEGNGPVSQWIYPIPKNLRNTNFLRNLTKERVINSIKHGVKGTPMAPWGEVGMDKPTADGIPVLTDSEIHKLADWLFSNVPGRSGEQEIPKWEYEPKDVLDELRREGTELKFKQEVNPSNTVPKFGFLFDGEGYFASVAPEVYHQSIVNQFEGSEIFDRLINPVKGPDKYLYYIKEKYYTPHNIEQGRAFFELNCAICHGTEADGLGIRAEVMQDAKPRMLTNLDWLETRDDLRLLRSIKYGVPGTSMTPWGDQTSALQRLQLVLFIRSLSQTNLLYDELTRILYKSFGYADLFIEDARVKEYTAIDELKHKYQSAQSEQSILADKIKKGLSPIEEGSKAYQNVLVIETALQSHQAVDQLLLDLKQELLREVKIYRLLGGNIIEKKLPNKIFDNYLKILELEGNRYHLIDGKLILAKDPAKDKEAAELGKESIQIMDGLIDEQKRQQKIIEGKIASSERTQEITTVLGEINGLTKFRNQFISGFHEALRSRQKQQEIYDLFQKKNKNLTQPDEKK